MNDYQSKACSTDTYPEDCLEGLLCVALGLASEAGEVAGAMRRIVRDDGSILSSNRKEQLKSELGDILWYVAVLSQRLNIPLDEVAEYNVKKLSDRAQRGVIRGQGDSR